MQVTLKGISFSYKTRLKPAKVLEIDQLHVESGARVALLGETGSGKSTLLSILAGLFLPDTGQVFYNDRSVQTRVEILELRRQVAISLQQPEEQFFAATVWDEVQFTLRNLGWKPADARKRAIQVLAAFGINPESYGPRSPFTLSGGEQRRVALAAALVANPALVLLDEPLAGLDYRTATYVWQIIDKCLSEMNATCIVATHDVEWALRWATYLVVLHEGRLSFCGTVQEMWEQRRQMPHLVMSDLEVLADELRKNGWSLPSGIENDLESLANQVVLLLRRA